MLINYAPKAHFLSKCCILELAAAMKNVTPISNCETRPHTMNYKALMQLEPLWRRKCYPLYNCLFKFTVLSDSCLAECVTGEDLLLCHSHSPFTQTVFFCYTNSTSSSP